MIPLKTTTLLKTGLLALVAAANCAAAAAPDAAGVLLGRLEKLGGLAGAFEQTLTTAEGGAPVVSTGDFAILRPRSFDWHYRTPEEQRVVSDGRRLWIYEPDLAQAVSKPAGGSLENSPAAVLLGSSSWRSHWKVEAVGGDTLVLTPKTPESLYKSVRLVLDAEGRPSSLTLEDAFGQKTAVRFTSYEKAVPAASRFEFTPPGGVEVLKDDKAF